MKLVVGISSRALFDLSQEHNVYENEGIEAYRGYQIAHESDPLIPGPAYGLVKKLLALNVEGLPSKVEVVLLSRNSADTGLRVFNSMISQQLDIRRAVFTSGRSPHVYAEAFGTHLFLSAHAPDVRDALKAGYAAAHLMTSRDMPSTGIAQASNKTSKELSKKTSEKTSEACSREALGESLGELRIAFDGDAVLFSDEADKVYHNEGLAAFQCTEQDRAQQPLPGGPFKGFLAALQKIQQLYPPDASPIRTALVTARSAPAHERVIRTLRAWNIRIDEAIFLGGLPKKEFLQAFHADIFFDDQITYCDQAMDCTTAAHVPYGVHNDLLHLESTSCHPEPDYPS